eukprot:CAMPEP_0119545314 /NCGR_PEP_ID=MMETSP1352-20130426/86_1 /TAXON_ID=265584 /ORGANISM="Stauroneis constricta, Strain CCMP1120" /LENGTH=152 /DNA_ID=CAMNT_0007589845 /DNA_START=71 /DNA_END=529 /DNA_ORIENTATION=+
MVDSSKNSNSNNANDENVDKSGESEGAIYDESFQPPFLPVLILAFPIMPLFWRYHVTITKTNLSFGYSTALTKKEMDRSDIESVEVVDSINGLTGWGGWGIRKNFSWETGYIAKNGPGIKVICKSGNDGKSQTYVFSTDNPKQVHDILSQDN